MTAEAHDILVFVLVVSAYFTGMYCGAIMEKVGK